MAGTNLNQSKVGAQAALGTGIRATFEVLQGAKKQTFSIHKDRAVIGAVVSADVKLVGSKIAPIHAVVEIDFGASPEASSARILDLASPGGTFVNGTRVVQQVIKAGDVVQIGDATLKFSFQIPSVASLIPDQALLLVDENQYKPIFDYRPPVKEALEVVYSWNDTILDIEHFTDINGKGQEVILGGTSDDDFLVPPVFSTGGVHTLAQKSGTGWTVFLDSKMKGVIYYRGELFSVEDFRRDRLSGDARGAVALGENDFIKIEAGSVQFYLSQTTSPPILKKGSTPVLADPFLAKTLIASIVLTALSIVSVYKMEPQPLEVVQVPETIATILYHPEKYQMKNFQKTPPQPKAEEKKQAPEPEQKKTAKEIDFNKPKEEAKVAQTKSPQPGKKQAGQNMAKEGEGARAKGAEGARGSVNSKNVQTKPQTSANRPSPEAGKDRGGTKSQSADNGNVQMIKGATNKILDLLGGSGEQLGKSGSKLQGFGGFTTQGQGGSGLQGTGKGGGGNADTLLGGLGEKGRGGGKVGTGLGAEGTGSGIIGGKTRIELRSGGGDETIVVGSIDRDAIDAAIKAHKDEFVYCYEREINSGHPTLAGKINTAFVIGGSGRASQLAIASSSMGNANVDRCVLQVLGRIQFPQPAGGVPVTIKYPFQFSGQK